MGFKLYNTADRINLGFQFLSKNMTIAFEMLSEIAKVHVDAYT
jgi:hypothetical protein